MVVVDVVAGTEVMRPLSPPAVDEDLSAVHTNLSRCVAAVSSHLTDITRSEFVCCLAIDFIATVVV